jgi:hypothetical protein
LLTALSVAILPAAETHAQSTRVFEWNRGNSTVGILLLHGLGGCAVPTGSDARTWCSGGARDSFRNAATSASWPAIMSADARPLLSAALPGTPSKPLSMRDLGVWGVDYSAATAAPCANFSIPQLAQTIQGQLAGSGFFDRYESVIIVAHSMGGLLVKQMIQNWVIKDDPARHRIIGVLLLGVPSQGSPAAPTGVWQYLAEALGLDRLARVCGRQVKDLVGADENTWLQSLETSWQSMLTRLRRDSRSQLPMTGCAYETVAERIIAGFRSTIVPMLYANTQCSLSSFPIGEQHTRLPKPASSAADVHSAWLLPSLTDILKHWSEQPLGNFRPDLSAPQGGTLAEVKQWLSSRQAAFSLDLDPVAAAYRIKDIPYKGPNLYSVVMAIVSENPPLCMAGSFPRDKQAVVTLRADKPCK